MGSVKFFFSKAGLAQSVERTALNRVVGGSSPPFGTIFLLRHLKNKHVRCVNLIFSFQTIPSVQIRAGITTVPQVGDFRIRIILELELVLSRAIDNRHVT
jgi:hypothetical protein